MKYSTGLVMLRCVRVPMELVMGSYSQRSGASSYRVLTAFVGVGFCCHK